MVAAEERKTAARKSNIDKESHKSSSPAGNKQAKGKDNKDKILSESKPSGKPVRDDAAEHEAKNQQAQNEKLSGAKTSSAGEPKVKDRGGYSGN